MQKDHKDMKVFEKKVYTILDANCNRLREACRVCEEITRFVFDDAILTAQCKKIRHTVTKGVLALPMPYQHIIKTRDSEGDCGKHSFIIDKKKETIEDVFIRNIKRAQEAARVLEEFVKLIDYTIARKFQKIRFALYDFEKKVAQKF